MRYTVSLFVIFIAIIGSLFVYSTTSSTGLTTCYYKGGQTIENIHYKSRKGDLDDDEKCKETKKLVDEIGVCYNKVKDNSYIPIEVVESITRITNPEFTSFQKLIDVHNESCPDLLYVIPIDEETSY